MLDSQAARSRRPLERINSPTFINPAYDSPPAATCYRQTVAKATIEPDIRTARAVLSYRLGEGALAPLK